MCCWAAFDITYQKEIDTELRKYRAALREDEGDSNRMLIVDDMEINRDILAGIFENKFEIFKASNGREALELLNNLDGKVDIILLDLFMPVMDGTEFLKIKRTKDNIIDTPVVIITSDETPEQQIRTLTLGANDYIIKPFVEKIVVQRVNNVIESGKRLREVLRKYSTAVERSHTDALTGIYNRNASESIITGVLKSQPMAKHAFIIIDVDNFKSINDNFGHDIGDEALINVADIIKHSFRDSDVVSRFGGDEFCVFMTNIPGSEIAYEKCISLCTRINARYSESDTVAVSVSIGVAISEGDSDTAQSLFKKADLALYDSKRNGKNRVSIYGETTTPPMEGYWVDKEWLATTTNDATFIVDYDTDDVLYTSRSALMLFGISFKEGLKCHDFIPLGDNASSESSRSRLSYDQFVIMHLSLSTGKSILLKRKLITFGGKKAIIAVAIDVSDIVEVDFKSSAPTAKESAL